MSKKKKKKDLGIDVQTGEFVTGFHLSPPDYVHNPESLATWLIGVAGEIEESFCMNAEFHTTGSIYCGFDKPEVREK